MIEGGLRPLASRDKEANDMLDTFDFQQEPVPVDIIARETTLDTSTKRDSPFLSICILRGTEEMTLAEWVDNESARTG